MYIICEKCRKLVGCTVRNKENYCDKCNKDKKQCEKDFFSSSQYALTYIICDKCK